MRPNRDWIYATPAQITYLRRLLAECFSKRVEGYYIRDWDRILRRDCSAMIDTLKTRLAEHKARG